MLERSANAAEIISRQVHAICSQLSNDIYIESFLDSKVIDRTGEYRAVLTIGRIKAFHSFVQNVGLYNGYLNRYINDSWIPMSERLLETDKPFMDFFPRVIAAADSPNRQEQELLTFVFHPQFSFSIPENASIEINVDPAYIQSIIQSLAGSSPETETIVSDDMGIVLSNTLGSMFMESLSGLSWAKRILETNEPGGFFIEHEGGKDQFVTFATSKEMGWKFISIKPYSVLLGNVTRLRNTTLIIALSLTIFGIIVSVFMTGIIYNPLHSIINRIGLKPQDSYAGVIKGYDEYSILMDTFTRYDQVTKDLKNSMQSSIQLARTAYTLGVLRVNFEESSIPAEHLSEIRNTFTGRRFQIAVLKIDAYRTLMKKRTEQDVSVILSTVVALASNSFSKIQPCEVVVSSKDETAVLMKLEREIDTDHLILAAVEVRDELRKKFSVTVTTGISGIVYDTSEIRRAYQSAIEMCRYRLFYGPGSIVTSESIRNRLETTPRYPSNIENKIIETLKKGDIEQLNKLSLEFLSSIKGFSYYQILNYASRLLLSVFRRFEETIELLDDNFKDYFQIIHDIETVETMEELEAHITNFFNNICSLLDTSNNVPNMKRNEMIVEQVKKYTLEHYTEPGLSLGIVADIVELSPGYLGKLFKIVEGNSFHEFLNKIRLDKAQELLTTTRKPASVICESVGIYNVTYFSTLFKKTYGLSPSRYRDHAFAMR